MKKMIIAAVLALSLLAAAACKNDKTGGSGTEGGDQTEMQTDETEKDTNEDPMPPAGANVPILDFSGIEGGQKLKDDMEAGRIPVKCNVLFDQMGGRPDVDVEDPEKIKKIYEYFSELEVGPESQYSITDSYHHVIFYLQDGTTVSYGFETAGLLCVKGNNYEVSGGGRLWEYVKQLQDQKMSAGRSNETETPGSKAAAYEGADLPVTVLGPEGEITITVPKGWYFMLSFTPDGYIQAGDFGIILWPAEDIEGRIEVFYTGEPAGFCGTGITQETMELGGAEAQIARYNDRDMWDHIVFTGIDEHIIAIAYDCGGDLWDTEFGGRALEILDTIEFKAN
ncbi:MAG: hypothetical protein IJM62_00505 [Lachnospiraceae bacterium]|nr:hypothetical protein [Lachnospiraceae bacterium]